MREVVLGVTCGLVIIASSIFIYEHSPHIQCFNWFGLAQGCVVTK